MIDFLAWLHARIKKKRHPVDVRSTADVKSRGDERLHSRANVKLRILSPFIASFTSHLARFMFTRLMNIAPGRRFVFTQARNSRLKLLIFIYKTGCLRKAHATISSRKYTESFLVLPYNFKVRGNAYIYIYTYIHKRFVFRNVLYSWKEYQPITLDVLLCAVSKLNSATFRWHSIAMPYIPFVLEVEILAWALALLHKEIINKLS